MSNWYNIGTPYHKFNPDYFFKKIYARLKSQKQGKLF